MTSADRNTYCVWVRNALCALGRGSPRQVADWIKAHEPVPHADLTGLTSEGKDLFYKNVRWARFTLFKAGIVSDREGRGVWTLA